MSDKHNETVLQECYNKRKQQNPAPSELHEQIMARAKTEQRSPWRWLSWQYAAAMFVVVIAYGMSKQPNLEANADSYSISASINDRNQVTYYHDVQLQVAQHPKQPSTSSQATHYQQYIASLAKLDDQRKLAGVIKNIDKKLVVKVCNVGVFEISKAMANALLKNAPDNTFYVGNSVFLNTDKNGFIQSIENNHSGAQCPS